jgi:hypothetical protein
MEIIKELKELRDNKENIDKLMVAIAIEQEELAKKVHLLKVINLSIRIEDILSKDFCKNSELKNIQIKLSHEYDNNTRDYEEQVTCRLVDAHNCPVNISDAPGSSQELRQVLNNMFYSIRNLKVDLYNEDFSSNIPVFLKLEAGIGEKILDLLLSKELQRVYSYSQMELSLSNNEENNRKKIKI